MTFSDAFIFVLGLDFLFFASFSSEISLFNIRPLCKQFLVKIVQSNLNYPDFFLWSQFHHEY